MDSIFFSKFKYVERTQTDHILQKSDGGQSMVGHPIFNAKEGPPTFV
jgi:hypothetical protein